MYFETYELVESGSTDLTNSINTDRAEVIDGADVLFCKSKSGKQCCLKSADIDVEKIYEESININAGVSIVYMITQIVAYCTKPKKYEKAIVNTYASNKVLAVDTEVNRSTV